MRIEYLKEFYALTEFMNFTNAAKKLYIAQPALSRHIAVLEEELGTTLLNRTTKSVELTTAGRILHDRLPAILISYNNMIHEIEKLEAEKKSLKIGLPAVPVNDYLRDVPSIFQMRRPDVEQLYHFGGPEENLNALLNGELDIILISNIPFPNHELLSFTDLSKEPMIVFLNENDPLASKRSVALPELKDCSFCCIDSAYFNVLWEKFSLECRWAGFQPKTAVCAKQFDASLAYVRQGRACVIAGGHHWPLAMNGLTYVRIENDGCSKTQALARLASNNDPLASLYIDTFLRYGNLDYTGK